MNRSLYHLKGRIPDERYHHLMEVNKHFDLSFSLIRIQALASVPQFLGPLGAEDDLLDVAREITDVQPTRRSVNHHVRWLSYAALHIAIEVWLRFGFKCDEVEALLEKKKFRLLLRDARNQIFHGCHINHPALAMLSSNDGFNRWALQLHSAMRRYTVEWFAANADKTTDESFSYSLGLEL